jgi:hypothetical protein
MAKQLRLFVQKPQELINSPTIEFGEPVLKD